MHLSKDNIRDFIMATVMISAGLYVLTHPVEKYAAEEKINLMSFIPSKFKEWESITYNTSDYKDKWQSINELLIRQYYKKKIGILGPKIIKIKFILEYSSDLRKTFSFHFPENCHRSSGNEVDFLNSLDVNLGDGRILKTKCLYIKGRKGSFEEIDKVVVYWLVIDNKQYYRTFFIKLDQLLSGLFKRAKRGVLVRVDYFDVNYTEENIQEAKNVISTFIKDLYNTLDEKSRKIIFGSSYPQNIK